MEIIEEKVDRRYEMNDCLDTNRLSNLLSHLLYRARESQSEQAKKWRKRVYLYRSLMSNIDFFHTRDGFYFQKEKGNNYKIHPWKERNKREVEIPLEK